MCVILYNENGKYLDKSRLEVAYENNPHGYGFMWVEDGRVNVIKGLCDFDQIWQVTKMLSGMTYALHFRWRTKGSISEDQSHPFFVLNKDEHGVDMCLMHNGTIFSIPSHNEKSDTQLFAEKLGNKILEKDKGYKFDYFPRLENVVGSHNKMVVFTSDSRTFFINKKSGKYIDGVWYSNTYSLQSGYRKEIIDPKEDLLEPSTVFTKDYGSRVIRRKLIEDVHTARAALITP